MMRPDQIERLRDLSEKLADVVLEEADPETWPGVGIPLADMTNEQRGNRYWAKKNAAATFALLERTSSLLTDVEDPHRNRSEAEQIDLDRQIAAAEKKSEKLLNEVMGKAKKVAAGGKP